MPFFPAVGYGKCNMALRFVLAIACLASLARTSAPAEDPASETVSTPGDAEAKYAGKGRGDNMTPAPTTSFGIGPCEQSIELILSPVSFGLAAECVWSRTDLSASALARWHCPALLCYCCSCRPGTLLLLYATGQVQDRPSFYINSTQV